MATACSAPAGVRANRIGYSRWICANSLANTATWLIASPKRAPWPRRRRSAACWTLSRRAVVVMRSVPLCCRKPEAGKGKGRVSWTRPSPSFSDEGASSELEPGSEVEPAAPFDDEPRLVLGPGKSLHVRLGQVDGLE